MTDATQGSASEDALPEDEQNPALPDVGQSDGNDEEIADQVPGPQG